MEQQFQTSFIPKKPATESRVPISSSVNSFMLFAVIILVVAGAMFGGAYLYKIGMEKKQESLSVYLETQMQKIRAETPALQAVTLVDRRLKAAGEIVKNHVLVSPIFGRLEQLTLKSIQFTKFELALENLKSVDIKMSGRAGSYTAIANQSDVLTGKDGAITYFINPIFSNLNLDDKARVSFDLTFSVDPDLVSYVDTLKRLGVSSENTQ